jgi:hypothetical protein
MKPKTISSHDAMLPVGCLTNDGAMVTHSGAPKPKEPRILRVCAKCSDMFGGTLLEDGRRYDGYVPDFFPGQHCGDYVQLDIDIETGQIVNWKRPTEKDLEIFKNE